MLRTVLTVLFTMLVGCGGEPCEYNEGTLDHGESITSEDGCSYCTCEDGLVTCVEIECTDTDDDDSGFWSY